MLASLFRNVVVVSDRGDSGGGVGILFMQIKAAKFFKSRLFWEPPVLALTMAMPDHDIFRDGTAFAKYRSDS